MIITKNNNYDTSLDACKGPTTLEVGKNTSAESILTNYNGGSEARNDCATYIDETEDESTD